MREKNTFTSLNKTSQHTVTVCDSSSGFSCAFDAASTEYQCVYTATGGGMSVCPSVSGCASNEFCCCGSDGCSIDT